MSNYFWPFRIPPEEWLFASDGKKLLMLLFTNIGNIIWFSANIVGVVLLVRWVWNW